MSMLTEHRKAAGEFSGRSFSRMLFLDLETRSEVDLRQVGPEVYAQHPSTELMSASWAVDEGRLQLWTEEDWASLPEVCPELLDPEVLCCFHNAEFEPRVILHKLGIDIPIERIIDSAAVARAANLPGGLDELGAFLLGEGKDTEGSKIMKKLSKPRRPSKTNPDRFWRPETKRADFETLYRYNGRDVVISRGAMELLPVMPQREFAIYRATYRMNARGIPIDRPSVLALRRIVDDTRAAMSAECERRYGFTLSQTAKIAEFLGTDDITKATIRDLLKMDDLHPDFRWVAQARQTFAKTSVDKLKAFDRRSRADGLVHDGIIYGGAERTLRFSGSGIQPQNIPRGLGLKQLLAFAALDAEAFELCYGGEELETVSGMLRGLIQALNGLLNVGDYSQIEARLLAWLVGDQEMIDVFATGGDPYKLMAGKIYGKPENQITTDERFMGKQTVLGCGYGLGKYGFAYMLDTVYDVQIEEAEADKLVSLYRKNAPKVTKFWRRLDNALRAAHGRQGEELVIIKGKLSIKFYQKDAFYIRLPSGRLLYYRDVKCATGKGGKLSWSCYGKIKGGLYGRVKIYGGALTGHIVQSAARDVICEAMIELDRLEHNLILTVHDELVEIDADDFDEFEAVMKTPPVWLTEFPLAVDTFQTERYRK